MTTGTAPRTDHHTTGGAMTFPSGRASTESPAAGDAPVAGEPGRGHDDEPADRDAASVNERAARIVCGLEMDEIGW